ncbi:MAG TPA: hypothetical protein VF587_14570 [Solirubrobacteraceae bacterium]|jgi:heme/copper-type cytochrome/quinol oxidase subunit 2
MIKALIALIALIVAILLAVIGLVVFVVLDARPEPDPGGGPAKSAPAR